MVPRSILRTLTKVLWIRYKVREDGVFLRERESLVSLSRWDLLDLLYNVNIF